MTRDQTNLSTQVFMRDGSCNATADPGIFHWPGDVWMSACGRVLLIGDDPYEPGEIVASGRCRASGCRQRWAKWVSEQ